MRWSEALGEQLHGVPGRTSRTHAGENGAWDSCPSVHDRRWGSWLHTIEQTLKVTLECGLHSRAGGLARGQSNPDPARCPSIVGDMAGPVHKHRWTTRSLLAHYSVGAGIVVRRSNPGCCIQGLPARAKFRLSRGREAGCCRKSMRRPRCRSRKVPFRASGLRLQSMHVSFKHFYRHRGRAIRGRASIVPSKTSDHWQAFCRVAVDPGHHYRFARCDTL